MRASVLHKLIPAFVVLLLAFPGYAQSNLYSNGSGNVGIGTNSPNAGMALDLSQNTNSLGLPVGTTGQRPTGVNGMLRYNSTGGGSIEGYIGGTWTNLGGGTSGGWVLLGTATASNSASVQFTSVTASGYAEWVVVWSDVQPATNATTFIMRISTGGAFKSGSTDYAYAFLGIDQVGNFGYPASSGDSSIPVTQSSLVSSSGNFSGIVHIYNPGGTTYTKNVTFQTFGYGTGPSYRSFQGGGSYKGATTALDGVEFLESSGNLTTGNFYLYGVPN